MGRWTPRILSSPCRRPTTRRRLGCQQRFWNLSCSCRITPTDQISRLAERLLSFHFCTHPILGDCISIAGWDKTPGHIVAAQMLKLSESFGKGAAPDTELGKNLMLAVKKTLQAMAVSGGIFVFSFRLMTMVPDNGEIWRPALKDRRWLYFDGQFFSAKRFCEKKCSRLIHSSPFVSSFALCCTVEYPPFLRRVPEEWAPFSELLLSLGTLHTFDLSSFLDALSQIAQESQGSYFIISCMSSLLLGYGFGLRNPC